ncbi:hypothetical protein [Microvirga mediterraneensis]|uniref:hypothetical protein n=1 Tax=Microvirga mediterraneensis TaxID=2754695 RepID=UPI003CCDB260
MPDGTPIFPDEPLLEIIPPIGQAQIIETFVLNQIGLQTILASKAARIVAAQGRPVVDFGARRAQGMDAALKGARASFIAGASATSNLAALGHPWFSGHNPVRRHLRHPGRSTTSRRACKEAGPDSRIRGVRLDTGNLAKLTNGTQSILDAAGLRGIQIFPAADSMSTGSSRSTPWERPSMPSRSEPV